MRRVENTLLLKVRTRTRPEERLFFPPSVVREREKMRYFFTWARNFLVITRVSLPHLTSHNASGALSYVTPSRKETAGASGSPPPPSVQAHAPIPGAPAARWDIMRRITQPQSPAHNAQAVQHTRPAKDMNWFTPPEGPAIAGALAALAPEAKRRESSLWICRPPALDEDGAEQRGGPLRAQRPAAARSLPHFWATELEAGDTTDEDDEFISAARQPPRTASAPPLWCTPTAAAAAPIAASVEAGSAVPPAASRGSRSAPTSSDAPRQQHEPYRTADRPRAGGQPRLAGATNPPPLAQSDAPAAPNARKFGSTPSWPSSPAAVVKQSAAGGGVREVVRSPRRWALLPLRISPEDVQTLMQLRIGLPVTLTRIEEEPVAAVTAPVVAPSDADATAKKAAEPQQSC